MNEARWPNSGADLLHPTLATITSVSTTSPPDGGLLSSTATATLTATSIPNVNWAGAIIHLGAGQNWVVQSGAVLSSSGNSLTFAFQHRTVYEIPRAGNQFYLTGSFKALNGAREWYRDPNTGLMYLWDGTGDNPAGHDVEAKHRLYAFELSGRSYINVSGIQIFAATIDTNSASTHLTLSNLTARYVSQQMDNVSPWDRHNLGSHSGILLNGSNNILQNSTIALSSGNGVWVGGTNNTVQGNTIHDVDWSGGDEAGITITGHNQQVLKNTIYNTGRDGILTSAATGGKIDHNTIHDIGTLTTDLGAIYTHGNVAGGTEIAFNTIYNVRTGGFGGVGVYLDNGSTGYVVHDNTISNTNNSLKVNPPGYGNVIYDNTVTYGAQVPVPSFAVRAYSSAAATLTILATLSGYRAEAYSVNSNGMIVGYSSAGPTSPAAIFSTAGTTNLGLLGGGSAAAYGINRSGLIVGTSTTSTGLRHAFLHTGDQLHDLGTLAGDNNSWATGINTAGQIVGVSYGASAVGHAFLYSGGVMHALGTLGGSISEAMAINDAGTIVGNSTIAGNRNAHAFAYSNGHMQDLGTLGGSSSYARAINSSGTIVGQSLVSGNGTFHAFSYSAGKMHDLGVLGGFASSVATGINDNGDIVGYCASANGLSTHAFLYRNGKMIDLTTRLPSGTGWTLISANAINNAGQIVGAATDANRNQRAYVLKVF
jgi:probable HAF family extracellular repeat protein